MSLVDRDRGEEGEGETHRLFSRRETWREGRGQRKTGDLSS